MLEELNQSSYLRESVETSFLGGGDGHRSGGGGLAGACGGIGTTGVAPVSRISVKRGGDD